MKKKTGFTLVELLVVMAIIAILASIAVPNAINYIRNARVTKAVSEITNIETALTKMISDAGRDSLHHLFNPAGIASAIGGVCVTDQQFKAATQIYTRTLYALMRDGRATLSNSDQIIGSYGQYLRSDVIRKLGTSYIDLTEDAWGNLYNIYPGPWRSSYNKADGATSAIPFRSFLPPPTSNLPGSGNAANMTAADDALIYRGFEDLDSGEIYDVGYPAPRGLSVFIWSNGENMLSSQAIYGTLGYDFAQEGFEGGGDDINNWDSNGGWAPFYN